MFVCNVGLTSAFLSLSLSVCLFPLLFLSSWWINVSNRRRCICQRVRLRRATWVRSSIVTSTWSWTALTWRGTATSWRGPRTDECYTRASPTRCQTVAPCWQWRMSSTVTPDSTNVAWSTELSLDVELSSLSKPVCAALSCYRSVTYVTNLHSAINVSINFNSLINLIKLVNFIRKTLVQKLHLPHWS